MAFRRGVTGKNLLGFVGLAVIALFWAALVGIYGGIFVIVLTIAIAVWLRWYAQRRKSTQPEQAKE